MILVEGYHDNDLPQIEISRSAISNELRIKNTSNLIAIVTDNTFDNNIQKFNLNDYSTAAFYISDLFKGKNI